MPPTWQSRNYTTQGGSGDARSRLRLPPLCSREFAPSGIQRVTRSLLTLGSAAGRHVRFAAPRDLFTKCTEALVERRGIVPERGVPRVRHDVNLRMR